MQCPVNMVAGIANILGVEEHRVTMQLQGVNHHIFATDVFLDGMSVMDEVVERYANVKPEDVLAMKKLHIPAIFPCLYPRVACNTMPIS
mgnify:FL=1